MPVLSKWIYVDFCESFEINPELVYCGIAKKRLKTKTIKVKLNPWVVPLLEK